MIKIIGLKKSFKVYRRRLGILRSLMGVAQEKRDYDLVESLKGVDLDIAPGAVHGVIGMNGAGKSTLLKILTGVLAPTEGRIEMTGRVAALLELGTGFHGELSGRDNVRINASIMGLSSADIEKRIPEIEDFSELGDFFDRPVKIYSSGMYVRLAFAFAVSVDPEILIIDEALSVGDAYFQQKCLAKIESFKKKGITIFFVSHDLGAVRKLCDSVSLLDKGQLIYTGTPTKALDLYNALLAEFKNQELIGRRKLALDLSATESPFESGNRNIEVKSIATLNAQGLSSQAFIAGEPIEICIKALINNTDLESPTCGILIKDRLGTEVFGTNTHCLGQSLGEHFQVGQWLTCRFHLELQLGPGDYTISVAFHSYRTHTAHSYHWIERASLIKVLASTELEHIGLARLPVRFESELRENSP